MAPILENMERRIRGALGGYTKILSHVDDIQVGIYDAGRQGTDSKGKREMGDQWLEIADTLMKEVGEEWNLPLEDDKHERLVLGCLLGWKKRKGKEGKEQKWVKWLGIIFDRELNFDPHWDYRIAAAWRLLGAIEGVGNS